MSLSDFPQNFLMRGGSRYRDDWRWRMCALASFVTACLWLTQPAAAQVLYGGDSGSLGVWRNLLDGSPRETLVSGDNLRFIALDLAAQKVYWTERSAHKIRRASLDGTSVEDVLTSGLNQPFAIAVDADAGKVYWSEFASPFKLRRADLDGTDVEDLVTGIVPTDIEIDATAGKIYWIIYDISGSGIFRANLNGSSVETVISFPSYSGFWLALDLSMGKLYWADVVSDRLRRANLDGTSIEDIVTYADPFASPSGITVDEAAGKLYWHASSALLRANRDGSGQEVLEASGYGDSEMEIAPVICGDGIVSPSEDCDDDNTTDGDCCSSACQYEALNSPCPDDGNTCSSDLCDASGTCQHTSLADGESCSNGIFCDGAETCLGGVCQGATPPCQLGCDEGGDICVANCPATAVGGCRTALKSLLLLKNDVGETADKLLWKFLKGEATEFFELANLSVADSALCVYTGPSLSLLAGSEVLIDSGPAWSSLGTGKLKYDDPTASSSGVVKAILKASPGSDRTKIVVKGKGPNLPDPMLAIPDPSGFPVTVQLLNNQTSVCWQSTFSSGDVKTNSSTQLKAKH